MTVSIDTFHRSSHSRIGSGQALAGFAVAGCLHDPAGDCHPRAGVGGFRI